MLGSFRYLLALLVTLSHLWTSLAGWSGVAAVFGFYVISGYLMTSVINRTYGFSASGLGRYALNRFLRIFPTYWVVMLFALIVVAAIPREAFLTNYKLSMPLSVTDWLANVFIVGLLDGPYKVLVPPAWTLDIEIFFYALMGLGLSRSRPVVLVWFVGSLLYTLWLLFNGAEFVDRYASYAAASLPFSAGAAIYMYRGALARFLCLPLPASAGLFFLALVASRMGWLGDPLVTGFYILLLCSVLLLISLINQDVSTLDYRWQKIDRLLGDLAYPIFLCHWQVAAVVLYFFWSGEKPEGGGLWLSSIVFIHAISFAIYFTVDKRINLIRDRIRGQNASI
ncbi:MAG: acyltransferase [Halioglobus sp.]